MRKTIALSAATLLLSTGPALLNLHAQAPQTTTTQTTTTREDKAPVTETTTVQTTTQANAVQSFNGKIDKKDDQYVLADKDKRASYKLDDATKADKYKGDDVHVVGTLDPATNMIHVQSIEKVKD